MGEWVGGWRHEGTGRGVGGAVRVCACMCVIPLLAHTHTCLHPPRSSCAPRLRACSPILLTRTQPHAHHMRTPLPQGKKVQQVACGAEHSVCVTDEGEVYAW